MSFNDIQLMCVLKYLLIIFNDNNYILQGYSPAEYKSKTPLLILGFVIFNQCHLKIDENNIIVVIKNN